MMMLFLFILFSVVILGLLLIFHLLKAMIASYIYQADQNDLSDTGVSVKSLIGLHVKALSLDELKAKLIYVRKTTPYQGLILFIPDWKYDYHFYLPFLYQLGRKGYLIVTYASRQELYAKTPEELPKILQMIDEDEVLSTYPLSVIGHGTGGYTAFFASDHLKKDVKCVSLSGKGLQIDALMHFLNNQLPFSVLPFRKAVLKITDWLYRCHLEAKLPETIHPTLVIQGQKEVEFSLYQWLKAYEPKECTLLFLKDKLAHPYLGSKSDTSLNDIIEKLKDPQISQFDYNKIKTAFDTSLLYDTDRQLLETICSFIHD